MPITPSPSIPTSSRPSIGRGLRHAPQRVMMGKMQGMECSHGQSHDKDFTVDLNKDAGADLVMDFVLFSGSDLHNHGKGQFDTVAFEQKRGYTVTEHSIPPDGTPANRHGQRYCEGVKPAGWSLPGWLRA